MSSARHGFRWWELDAGYYSLVVLARLVLIWDLRQPAPEDRHRITRAGHAAEATGARGRERISLCIRAGSGLNAPVRVSAAPSRRRSGW